MAIDDISVTAFVCEGMYDINDTTLLSFYFIYCLFDNNVLPICKHGHFGFVINNKYNNCCCHSMKIAAGRLYP